MRLPEIDMPHRYRRGHGFKSRTGLRFFTAVQIYEFHLSKIIIHHLNGLFGPNILTISHLASLLSWQSAAPVLQRSWIQIPHGPEFFSGPIFNYQFSSVLSCEDLLNSLYFRVFIQSCVKKNQPDILPPAHAYSFHHREVREAKVFTPHISKTPIIKHHMQ